MMTAVRKLAPCSGGSPLRHRDLISHRVGRLVTVATISGDIDATNIVRITAHFTRLVLLGNALLLDLSGVGFLAARSASALLTVDHACRRTNLSWALVTNHAVDRALRIGGRRDTFPVAGSTLEAMDYFADLSRGEARSQTKRPHRFARAPMVGEPVSGPR